MFAWLSLFILSTAQILRGSVAITATWQFAPGYAALEVDGEQ
jgi:hypothetical protein